MRRAPAFLLVLVASLALVGCDSSGRDFSGARARKHVEHLCSLGPRPVGSEASTQGLAYISDVLLERGWEVEEQRFAFKGKYLTNVIAKKGHGPLIILGTHHDTRPLSDRDPADRSRPVMGANDGGSGVGVLLELGRVLDSKATDHTEIWLVFFDGEAHNNIEGWPWNVGASHFVDGLLSDRGERPEYTIIVDMVGDTDQRIHYEWSSTLWLQEKIWDIAAEQGYGAHFIREHKYRIIDDHSPFVLRGMPAALIIDFDYPYWHTRQDTLDKVSADSLQRVGLVLETLLEREPLGVRMVSRSQ